MRILILSIFTLVLFASAIFFEKQRTDTAGISHYAAIVSQNLQQRERKATNIIDDIASKMESAANVLDANIKTELLNRTNDNDADFSLLYYNNDSLVFWSSNTVIVPADSADALRHLANGFYYVKKRPISNGRFFLIALPIKHDYCLDFRFNQDNEYLKNTFVTSDNIYIQLRPSASSPADVPIHNLDGKACGYLSSENAYQISENDQYTLLLLYLFSFIGLAILVNTLTVHLMNSTRPRLGMLFFFLSVIGIKCLTIILDFGQKFNLIPLFIDSEKHNTLLSTSPGAMFVNSLLLLWIIIFYYKYIKSINATHYSAPIRVILMVVFYVAILCGILMTISMHQSIVSSPTLLFDFENFYYIDLSSALTILCLLLVWFALFLFNYKIVNNIKTLQFNRFVRSSVIILLSISLYLILWYKNSFEIDARGIVLFCFIYILLLDFFCEYKENSNLSWFLLWLCVFAGATTELLYSYKRNADLKLLSNVVNRLAMQKDDIAIKELQEITDEATTTHQNIHSRSDLQKFVNNQALRKSYLFDNYRLLLSDSSIYANKQEVRYFLNKDSILTYTTQLPILTLDSTLKHYRLEVIPAFFNTDVGYEEKIFESPYLNIKDASNINYSIFDREKNLIRASNSTWVSYPQPNELPNLNEYVEIKNLQQSKCILRTSADIVVIGTINYGGLHKILFLFTYIFVYLFGISCFIITLNTFTNILDTFFVFPKSNSLESRVEIGVISLVTFACIFIGSMTIMLAKNAFDKSYIDNLTQKTQAVQKNIEADIKRDTTTNLTDLTVPISETHQVDIIAYDMNGELINPMQKSIFRKGILSNRMNPLALKNLKDDDKNITYLDEKIGDLGYKAAYLSVEKDGKKVAYLNLPYYRKEWEKKEAISSFTGALLAVYVFLFIPMVIFTYMVGESLMKPIRNIGEKLKLVKLGQTRLDVEWKGKDALGDLIREFNVMLENLDKEAKAEQQTARDKAWRAMARQVAHDIRNPLTPMKLSIQYLQMSADNEDINPDVKEKVSRIANTIVEQINNLNQIATNFADYSKTQTESAAIEKTNLNEFIARNCEVFLNSPDPRMTIKMHLPEETDFYVNMDRTQMSRVVTNLITNAKQAIPDNRDGRIDIYLYEKDKNAVIRISDNGTGIPEEQMEQIFQPNFTTRSSGSGLGLAICRRLVEDIQGTIHCTSTVNQGSDFFVTLPILEAIPIEKQDYDEEDNY